jgi:general secretion pathway protein G
MILSIQGNLELYKTDNGGYPSAEVGLHALLARPGNAASWGGPYITTKSLPVDPWNRPFLYRIPSSRPGLDYDLCSYGAYGKPGGTGENAPICNEHNYQPDPAAPPAHRSNGTGSPV